MVAGKLGFDVCLTDKDDTIDIAKRNIIQNFTNNNDEKHNMTTSKLCCK
jgi:hypothetical protein